MARSALDTLRPLCGLPAPTEIERHAAIQRFEYTVEATWHAAQRFLLLEEGLAENSPKGCARASRQVGLLQDLDTALALAMVDDRNLTAHTYNRALAEKIYSRLEQYAPLI